MYTIPSLEERVSIYLAPELRNGLKVKQKLPQKHLNNVYIDNKFVHSSHGPGAHFSSGYAKNFEKIVSTTRFKNHKAIVMIGDSRDLGEHIAFAKTRAIHNSEGKYTLLKCFNQRRHWDYSQITSIHKRPLPEVLRFSDKKNTAIWRGCANGGEWGWDLRPGNRFCLVEHALNNPSPLFDIKFSKYPRETLKEVYYPVATGKPYPIHKMREHKYIISVEGNDKDTGLNWKLKSNSAVLMARPRITSWLMEEKLIPNFHYIELRDDFKDLEEKIEWCNNHYKEVIEIIKNAHHFMSQFEDESREDLIQEKTIEKHFELVDYH